MSHFAQKKEKYAERHMASRDMAIGIMFFSQTTFGILGNFFFLFYYLVLYYNVSTLKATDLILKHLMIANSLVILSQGVPQTMAAFGLKHLFNGFGCEFLFCIQRVGRSVSIAITCFLSIFQNIMISPMNSCWKDLKIKAPKYISFSISLCWIMYLAVNFVFSLHAFGKWSSKNMTMKRDLGYCSTGGHENILDSLYAALFVFPEIVFSVFMAWSSGSMIIILYRHKQRVQHIHSMTVSRRSSPESRATQSILVLVCTFVTFYTLSSLLNVCIALFHNPSWWLVNMAALISVCFPTVSPFLLMSHDSTLLRFCFVWKRNTKYPNLIITI